MAYATFEEKDGKTLKFVDTDSEEEYEVPDSYANLTYLKGNFTSNLQMMIMNRGYGVCYQICRRQASSS